MLLYKLRLYLGWKIKILSLKILFGKRISLRWSDRIASSVKVRINGNGFIRFGEQVEIRENCIFNVTAGGRIDIDDRVFINDGCCINARDMVCIGADTMLGQGVKIYDHDHDYHSTDIKKYFKIDPVNIGKNTWICSDVIILKGCEIGEGSVVAAGTIVRKNVSQKVMYYSRRDYGERDIDLSKRDD